MTKTATQLDTEIAEFLTRSSTRASPQWWFHTSSKRNRTSIERHGLLLSKVYDDGMTPVGIYFTERPPAPGERDNADVWAADLTDFALHPDPFCGEDEARGACVYVTRDVPSKRLQRLP